jgi:hypothetical protein
VVAYADDVTIFVTAPADMLIMKDFLLTYERATGACLNIRKSKAIVSGSCDTSINMTDITHYPEITIKWLIREYISPFRERHLVNGHKES